MPNLSYNDSQQHSSELRHLFVPNGFGLASEVTLAIVALVLLNLSTLNQQVISANAGIEADPLKLWGNLFNKIVGDTQKYAGVQEFFLFALWATVGALAYILLFRSIQLFIRARSSARRGATLIQAQHSRGALRYFASLHDVFIKLIIIVSGAAALLTGTLVCFAIASQELNNGLQDTFPHNLLALLLSFVGAFLAVRVIAVGISLLSPRFRAWYNV